MTKSKKITLIVSISLILLFAVLGTIFDLQISKALADVELGQYYSNNFFAIFFECFGEDVLYLFIICALGILFFYLIKNPLNKKWLNILLLVLICFASYIVSVYSFNKTLNYIARYTNFGLDNYLTSIVGIITVVLLSIVINIALFFIISKLNEDVIKSLWKWAILVLIVAVISNGIVQVSKHIFDRTRYRAMMFVGDENFSYFTYWFTINTNKFNSVSPYAGDFFKSFPSGHTCAAASVFLLVLLPNFLAKTNTKKCKAIFWSVAVAYTLLVAFSRIVAGAHFFMDVYIGAMVTIATVFVSFLVFQKITKRKSSSSSNTPTSTPIEVTTETSTQTASDTTNS